MVALTARTTNTSNAFDPKVRNSRKLSLHPPLENNSHEGPRGAGGGVWTPRYPTKPRKRLNQGIWYPTSADVVAITRCASKEPSVKTARKAQDPTQTPNVRKVMAQSL